MTYELLYTYHNICTTLYHIMMGAQWLSGSVLDSRPRGSMFEPQRCHCVVSLSKNINPSSVLVQPRKTHPFMTERLLIGRKESNQTNKQNHIMIYDLILQILLVKKCPFHIFKCIPENFYNGSKTYCLQSRQRKYNFNP